MIGSLIIKSYSRAVSPPNAPTPPCPYSTSECDTLPKCQKSQDARFDRLEALIEKGFSALAQDIADTKSEVAAVKADLAEFRIETHESLADIGSELKDIRNRLDALESSVHNISGYAKEIDHLMERVNAIEKHLGLRQKAAA